MRLRLLALLVLLQGCNGGSYVLPAVPVEIALTNVTQSSNFAVADGASFSKAKLLYPSSDAHHIVPVGDYLLAAVVTKINFGDSRPIRITLQDFAAKCDADSFFAPKAACTSSITLAVLGGGGEKKFVGQAARTVGPVFVAYGDPFGTPADGTMFIGDQARILIDGLVSSVRPAN